MENFNQETFAKFMAFMESEQAKGNVETTSERKVSERPNPKVKATPLPNDDEDQDDDLDFKNDFMIAERVRTLTSQNKFYEATSLYAELTSDDVDIGMKLLTAECYIQLGRENKAEKAVRDIEKILTKHPMCDVDDIVALAEDLIGNSNHIRALLLLRIAGDMFKNSTSLLPDEILGGLFRCIRKMVNPVLEMINPEDPSLLRGNKTEGGGGIAGLLERLMGLRALAGGGIGGENLFGGGAPLDENLSELIGIGSKRKPIQKSERLRVIALDYGVEVMENMLEDLFNVPDADPENKALKYCILANAIGKHYAVAAQHAKVMKILNFGIKVIEDQFGKRSDQHHIYAIILLNMSAELHNSEKFQAAEVYGVRALEAMDFVTDFNDESERRSELSRVRESLRITRMHLKLA